MAEKRRRASDGEQPLPDGPRSLTEVLDLPVEYARNVANQPALLSALSEQSLVVTSSYSGTGGFEAVVDTVMRSMSSSMSSATHQPRTPTVVFYAAWDSAPAARDALLSHSVRTRPKHVSGDLLDRVPVDYHVELKRLERSYLDQWAYTKREAELGGLTKQELAETNTSLGAEYVAKLSSILKGVCFLDDAWCYVDSRRCPSSPRRQESLLQAFI
jgi:hypothetical protein